MAGFEKLYNNMMADFEALPAAFQKSLPTNPVFLDLVDKVSTQYLVDQFNYENKVLARYLRASSIAGGIDEILSADNVRWRQYDPTIDWTKDYYINEQYKMWAIVDYEDQYDATIPQIQAQQAFLSAANFGSFLGLIMKRFEDTKRVIWYYRLIELYKKYPVVITLQSDPNDPVSLYKEITYHMSQMALPSTAYNLAGKMNATPYDQQQITWNVFYQNEAQWITSRLFNQGNIDNISKVIWGQYLNFDDKSIVAILDTQDTLYIGLKQQIMNYQTFAQQNRIQYYRTEIYTTAIVPFANGVMFKTQANSDKPKEELKSVLENTKITVTGTGDAELKAGVEAENDGFKFTPNELVYVLSFDPNKKVGKLRVNATASSEYTGIVDFNFTVDNAGSSNFGR